MNIATSAAHLAVCECGQHAKIVMVTGETTDECYSKEELRRVVDSRVKQEEFDPLEVPELLRQIDASQLPERDEDRELIEQRIVEMIARAISEIDRESPENFEPEFDLGFEPTITPTREWVN